MHGSKARGSARLPRQSPGPARFQIRQGSMHSIYPSGAEAASPRLALLVGEENARSGLALASTG